MIEIPQLLLSKFLFLKAQDFLKKDDPFSCGLAISLFQDSIEILLWAIAKHVDADVKEKDSFDKFWEKVETAKKNSGRKIPPLKSKILELNKVRINFKHYGITPDPSEAFRLVNYADEFLHESMKLFFNVDFDDVSLADLILDGKVKEKIKHGEKLFDEGKLMDCIGECAIAETFILRPLSKIIPSIGGRFGGVSKVFKEKGSHDIQRIFDSIGKSLEILRELVISSMLKINISEYMMFQSLAPHVNTYLSGKTEIIYKKSSYTKQEAYFCLKYITNYALTVQTQIYSEDKTNV